MGMLDEEITRLGIRLKDLQHRIIPDFESKTGVLFSRIQAMSKDKSKAGVRTKLELEYTKLSKELRQRSDEQIQIRHEIERLELQKKFSR
ncbi:MAG TPA: hypothetical protein QF517_10385 [Pseudomonadales bacterium]|jgi:hypothetical protein|nr:hypothetical protein [Gammaproteobacteria bacterium]MDP6026142.1 hypothetical protein [Pseudomonadales bacterium]MDP7451241.1 hypothetical protein [Arenicellales bacterium]MDP6314993.1 hypothetical protein [Pseudomonadales bacterium]MDP7314871.1 hypothetical protein [Pseudomonadales bacterium]|tara:strand:- start:1592 stop:1861 length:270 start_codon:yes stop_codon:yes gene_type:complete